MKKLNCDKLPRTSTELQKEKINVEKPGQEGDIREDLQLKLVKWK